jgi:hypothetical protein
VSYGGDVATTLTIAVGNMETNKHTNATGRTNTNVTRINLGGKFGGPVTAIHTNDPLATGIFSFGGDVTIASDITFDGNDSDVFIIQIVRNLYIDNLVNLGSTAKVKNIFWQFAGFVEVPEGAHMEGILLVFTNIKFKTGSSPNDRDLMKTIFALDQVTAISPS